MRMRGRVCVCERAPTTASRISRMPIPFLAEACMASVQSSPIVFSISSDTRSASACVWSCVFVCVHARVRLLLGNLNKICPIV